MLAYRLKDGVIREIQVDVGLDGQPLLPPNTTVNEKPEVPEGYKLTIRGSGWELIKLPTPTEPTIDSVKRRKLEQLNRVKSDYLDSHVEHDGRLFDADGIARDRLSQALLMAELTSVVPPVWIDANNNPYEIVDQEALKTLGVVLYNAFSSRFYELTTARLAIEAATTIQEVNEVVIPGSKLPTPPVAPVEPEETP